MVASAQSVGIGTNTPNSKAALDVQSTKQGILFPRMNTSQRDSIENPPDGLHIYNTDDHCLNFFDSSGQTWNCYCGDCKTVVINVTANVCPGLNFYETYAKTNPSAKYVLNIAAGITVCNLSFETMPANVKVTINNRGTIAGNAGKGGDASMEPQGLCGSPGATGFPAIMSRTQGLFFITVNNYGIVAGGGGGGGGGSANPNGIGGGGGGGASLTGTGGVGGLGGGTYTQQAQCFGPRTGIAGSAGNTTTGGAGGAGTNGGGAGGTGGGLGQPGQAGIGQSGQAGGLAGKAIEFGAGGNLINNLNGGVSYGAID